MQFSYQFDVAGIMVILTSLTCAWIRPKLMKNFGFNLKLLICSAIVYNVLDSLTVILLKIAKPESYYFTYVMLLIYFCVLYLIPYCATRYFYQLCGEEGNLLLLRGALAVMIFFATFGNIFFNFLFFLDKETMSYSHGTMMWVTFVYYMLCATLVGHCAVKHSRYLGKVRKRLLITVFFITILNLFYQAAFPEESLTGLVIALALAMFIVVFCFVDVTVDELTGLNNKTGFIRSCDELMHQQSMEGYSMVKIQIYHMQELNERTGMENGDRVLNILAENIEECVNKAKHKAVCGRIGGDTFAVLTDEEVSISTIASSDITEAIQNPLTGLDYAVSFYAGVYRLEEGDKDIDKMLDHAGYALKWVSGNFKTNVAFYDDDIRKEDEHRKIVEQRVRGAILDREFKVYLQPVCDTMTRQRISAEALVRWIDSKNQMINPSDFIPILEKNGFITELDLYVLEEVCRMLRDWINQGASVVPVSVNFSRVDVDHHGIVEEIVAVVDKYGLDHKLIKIELTESAFNDNMDSIIKMLSKLRSYGFVIMMDDFGSGYSNLNMFKDLPVDVVKIDMYFLRNIENSEKGMIVLESVVQMAKRLGLKIVVEGVETQEQYDYIRKLHCEMIQGFYFAKPMPSEVFSDQVTAG
ncbi:putative bifunctional diguanylate cyclase/phosphodiesterase [Butyrivibrio sp. LC3010]|uniref:putative bifunctional diguanylate cyclase/phosphodiesterase n=1 Tax=Butyrivibrio sp. LC3010 TaxID=1280680 RepID=UPI000677A779|nr:GGDEF domain-containing phosphodiesterase [Butyrivibrio sp. LC3010]